MRSATMLLAFAALSIFMLGGTAASAAVPTESAWSAGNHELTAVESGGEVVLCSDGQVQAYDAVTGEVTCASLQIGIGYSPNPVPYGGTTTITVSVNPATDCWDSAGRGGYGGFSFTTGPLYAGFPYTAYCAGAGTESTTLNIYVNPPPSSEQPPPPPPPSGGNVPAVSSAPTISGTPEAGKTLTASHGNWTNTPTSYKYVWRRSGDLQQIGTASTLALSSAHVGYQIRVDVQACNGTGCGSWSSSNWTAAVAQAPPPPAPVVDSDGDGISDSNDNCPTYYSRDNKCDSDVSYYRVAEHSRSLAGYTPPLNCPPRTTGSAWRSVSVTGYNVFGNPLVRFILTVGRCWNRSVITKVEVRPDYQLLALCCWFERGIKAYDVIGDGLDARFYANWNRDTFTVYAKYGFEQCLPKGFGCLREVGPWIRLTVYRGYGSAFDSGVN